MVFSLYGWQNYSKEKDSKQMPEANNSLRFSIVIPTLNQADTLEHTLLSIINQDHDNVEIIVIDGGSTDNTQIIIDKYRYWIDFYSTGKDSGQSDAINKGFNVASGDIFAWINSDDYYLPFAFSRVSDIFESNLDIDILVGAGDIITKDSKFLKHIESMHMVQENLIKWTQGEWIMQQSCFWRKRIWKSSGGVDTNLNLLMDFDLWLRFARLGQSQRINETLAAMRYYPEVKTVSLKDKVKEELAYVFAKNSEYSELRKIVNDLVSTNKRLVEENTKYERSYLLRLLRRVGFNL